MIVIVRTSRRAWTSTVSKTNVVSYGVWECFVAKYNTIVNTRNAFISQFQGGGRDMFSRSVVRIIFFNTPRQTSGPDLPGARHFQRIRAYECARTKNKKVCHLLFVNEPSVSPWLGSRYEYVQTLPASREGTGNGVSVRRYKRLFKNSFFIAPPIGISLRCICSSAHVRSRFRLGDIVSDLIVCACKRVNEKSVPRAAKVYDST
jgi:hypothetical protein